MKNPIFRIPALLTAFIFLSGCVATHNHELARDLKAFASGTRLVIEASERGFDFVEKSNRYAVQSNIALQFDLGGRPKIGVSPLFNNSIRAGRQSVQQNLALYAHKLTAYYPNSKQDFGSIPMLDFKSLKDLDSTNFEGLLQSSTAKRVIDSLSDFSRFLLRQDVNQTIGNILQQANSDVQSLYALMYLDIGGVQDKDNNCAKIRSLQEYTFATLPDEECRGGLRALLDNSRKQVEKSLQLRIQLSTPAALRNSKDRDRLISRIYELNENWREWDDTFVALQSALKHLAHQHEKLTGKFESRDAIATNQLAPSLPSDGLQYEVLIVRLIEADEALSKLVEEI